MTAWPRISSELSTRKKASWPSGAPAWSQVKGLNIPSLVSETSHSCVLVCRVTSGSMREESKHWTCFRTGTLCLRQLHQLFSGERSGLQTRPSHQPQHRRSVQSCFRWHHTLVTINTFRTPIICICHSLCESMNCSIFLRYTHPCFSNAWYQHASAFGILDFPLQIELLQRCFRKLLCIDSWTTVENVGVVVFWSSVQVSQWRVWKQQDKWHQQENVATSLSPYIKVTWGLFSITSINITYVIIVAGCLSGCLAARGLAEGWWFEWDDGGMIEWDNESDKSVGYHLSSLGTLINVVFDFLILKPNKACGVQTSQVGTIQWGEKGHQKYRNCSKRIKGKNLSK